MIFSERTKPSWLGHGEKMEKSTRSGPLVTPLCGVAAGAARRGPDPCYFKWEWWEFSMFFLMFFLHVFYHGTYHWRNMFNGKSWKISWKYHWRHMFHGKSWKILGLDEILKKPGNLQHLAVWEFIDEIQRGPVDTKPSTWSELYKFEYKWWY